MKYIALTAAVVAAAGCSTVIRGTKETAVFESSPAGATVTAERITENDDNPVSCVTPCKLELSRKRDFNIVFELEGHKPAKAKLASLITAGGGAGFLGNAVLGGGVGAIVDAGTGATHDLRPNPAIAKLVPLGSSEESTVIDEDGDPAPAWVTPEMAKKTDEALQKAGEKVDEAAAEVDDAADEAAEDIKDAAEDLVGDEEGGAKAAEEDAS